MGIKFSSTDSVNLITALTNNVEIANQITDRLSSGCDHLINSLNSGELQGAAYTVAKGLFSELIIPSIKKLQVSIDDIDAEIKSYKSAHSVVEEYDILDMEDLQKQLNIKYEQLHAIEEQLGRNKDFFNQVGALFSGKLGNLYAQNYELERVKEQINWGIDDIKTKINKLEWFISDTSKYFSDSLQVLSLAIKGAMELGKITVDSNGNHYTNGADMNWSYDMNKIKITTEGNLEKVLMNQYGLTANEARIISLAQSAYLKKSKDISEHEFLAMIATLCDNYRSTRWSLTAGTGTKEEAEEFFKKLGLTDNEIKELYNTINNQHSRVSSGETAVSDRKRDFAHEMIALSIFTNPSVTGKMPNPIVTPKGYLDLIMGGQLNQFSSYKGDISSGRFGVDDMQSDTDVTNIYNRSVNNNSSVMSEFTKYNNQLSNGEVNRAEEFLKTLGNGDIESGKEVLKNQINSYTGGDEYMAGIPSWNKTKSVFNNILTPEQIEKEWQEIDKHLDEYKNNKTENLQNYVDYLEKELSK